jgi:hypothetical protein
MSTNDFAAPGALTAIKLAEFPATYSTGEGNDARKKNHIANIFTAPRSSSGNARRL